MMNDFVALSRGETLFVHTHVVKAFHGVDRLRVGIGALVQ